MKRALLFFCCIALSFLAEAQNTTYNVNIDVTPGAVQAGCSLQTVSNTFTLAMSNLTAQGVTAQLLPSVNAAVTPLPDTSSMQDQFVYEQTSLGAWKHRAFFSAVAGIVVSAPPGGASVAGIVPLSPPTNAKDSTASVNCANLQYQLQNALARILGQTLTNGVTVRQRTYDGTNVCFHTQGAPASDPNAQLPYLGGWASQNGNGGAAQSKAGAPADSCEMWRLWNIQSRGQSSNNYTRSVSTYQSANSYACTIYNTANSVYDTAGTTTYPAPPGSSTITCPNGNTDTEISLYSCYGASCKQGSTYTQSGVTYAIGTPTQDAAGTMAARTGTVYGLGSGNATNLNNAQGAIASFVSWVQNLLS